MSTTEAELYALAACAVELLHVLGVLRTIATKRVAHERGGGERKEELRKMSQIEIRANDGASLRRQRRAPPRRDAPRR